MAKVKFSIRPGSILLSEPFMQDPMFGRAVVLVCHHDAEGSFGLILNKEAANPFEENEEHALKDFPFFGGGPVETSNMFFVHNLTYLPDCVLLKDGICWQGDYDSLLDAIEEGAFRADNGRLIVGYAGWAAGQLAEEMDTESWMVYNGPIDSILTIPADQLWKHLLQSMGPYYKMVSNFPPDPLLN